jgi:hypothetical protein
MSQDGAGDGTAGGDDAGPAPGVRERGLSGPLAGARHERASGVGAREALPQ